MQRNIPSQNRETRRRPPGDTVGRRENAMSGKSLMNGNDRVSTTAGRKCPMFTWSTPKVVLLAA